MNGTGRFLLRIPGHIFREIMAHAERERPLECCGVLSGLPPDDGIATVTKIHQLRNQLRSEREFLSDPYDMLAAVKKMREQDTQIIAVYHSHPASPPIPSQRDQERNFSESVVNLIVGWGAAGAELRAWWVTGSGFAVADWELADEP